MAIPTDKKNAYSILGLHKGCSFDEVKHAYVRLVKKYDPEMHTERFMVIDKAYQTLKNPVSRAKEDVLAFNFIKGEFLFNDDEKADLPEAKINAGIQQLQKQIESGELPAEQGNPKLIQGYMLQSWKYLQKRLWAEAIGVWESVLRIDPTHRRAKNNLMYSRLTLAYNYANHELYDEAAEIWEAAVRMDPDNENILQNLAIAYEKAGHIAEATRYWDEVVKRWKQQLDREPDNEYLKNSIIEVLRLTNDRDKAPAPKAAGGPAPAQSQQPASARPAAAPTARPNAQQPVAATPQPRASSNLDDLREILRLNPDDFEAHFKICNILYQQQNWSEATKELMALRRKKPRNVEVMNLLGWALLNDNQHDAAFMTWKKARQIDPKNPEINDALIRAHMQMGRMFRDKAMFTPCLKHFKELQRYQPESDEVVYELGETYRQKGDERSAFQYFNLALKMNPKNRGARNGLSSLKLNR